MLIWDGNKTWLAVPYEVMGKGRMWDLVDASCCCRACLAERKQPVPLDKLLTDKRFQMVAKSRRAFRFTTDWWELLLVDAVWVAEEETPGKGRVSGLVVHGTHYPHPLALKPDRVVEAGTPWRIDNVPLECWDRGEFVRLMA